MNRGQHNRQIYRDHKCNFKIFANIFMIMVMYFNLYQSAVIENGLQEVHDA